MNHDKPRLVFDFLGPNFQFHQASLANQPLQFDQDLHLQSVWTQSRKQFWYSHLSHTHCHYPRYMSLQMDQLPRIYYLVPHLEHTLWSNPRMELIQLPREEL